VVAALFFWMLLPLLYLRSPRFLPLRSAYCYSLSCNYLSSSSFFLVFFFGISFALLFVLAASVFIICAGVLRFGGWVGIGMGCTD